MRFGLALSLLFISSATACAPAYASRYNQTNHRLNPTPVTAKDVLVVKSRDDLVSQWTEIGTYRGKAPTVHEAMDIAKEQCGSRGANLYILNVEPYPSEGGFRVDGICALR